MSRKNPPRLVVPTLATVQEELRQSGVGSARDRVLAEARLKKANADAAKRRVVDGEIESGDAVEQILALLDELGMVKNRARRGGRFGYQLVHPAIVNANSPVIRAHGRTSSDTASTTNTGSTVVSISGTIALPYGKWYLLALFSVLLRHSAGGSTRLGIEADGTESLAGAVASVPASSSERVSMPLLTPNVVGGRDVTVKGRYRSEASGTTSAKNPELLLIAWRFE